MNYLIICLFVSVFVSCSNNNREISRSSNKDNAALKKYIKTVPAYVSFINTPQDSLLFGFNKGSTENDTSWTFLVTSVNGIIRGYYTQLLPFSVVDFNNSIDGSTNVLYHEGF